MLRDIGLFLLFAIKYSATGLSNNKLVKLLISN